MIQAKMLFNEAPGAGSGSKIPVGIQSGVSFNGLVRDQEWWDIKFSKDGQQLHKRLFDPTGSYQFDDETPEQALEREMEANLRHAANLAHVIVGEKASEIEAPDYHAFMKAIADAVNPHKGFLVNLKVIPDRKLKYPDLGKYPNYLERHQEGVESKLKYSKKELELLQKYQEEKDKADSEG